MHGPVKRYRWLLKLYPARFREEYESPMERQFLDDYRDAHNRTDRIGLWMREVRDSATLAPREFVREFRQDLQYASRVYRNRSLIVGLAVLALALAIGASTTVFSVLNALLLRSLPFSDSARLVELWSSPVTALSGRVAFKNWQGHSTYLDGAATFSVVRDEPGPGS